MINNIFIDGLKVIGGIVILILIFYGYAWLMAAISKASGRTVMRNGKVMYTPDDFDYLNKMPKELALKVKNSIEKLPNKFQSLRNSLHGEKAIDKIKALTELAELLDRGVINEKEFYILKDQILQ
jgi:hypothetical protein